MSDFSFLENEEAKPQYTGATVKELTGHIEMVKSLLALLEGQEEAVRETKQKLKTLVRQTIPDLFQSNGTDAIGVPGLGVAKVGVVYRGSVAKERWGQFCAWAKKTGNEWAVKETAVVADPTPAVLETLAESGAMFDVSPATNWQTMAKLVKTLAETNQEIPEAIAASQYRVVQIPGVKLPAFESGTVEE